MLQIWESLNDQKAFLVFCLLDPRRQAVILLLCVDAPTLMDKMSRTIGPQSDINPNRTKIYPLPTVCPESISVRDDHGIDLRSVSTFCSEKSLVLVDRAPVGVIFHVHQYKLNTKNLPCVCAFLSHIITINVYWIISWIQVGLKAGHEGNEYIWYKESVSPSPQWLRH